MYARVKKVISGGNAAGNFSPQAAGRRTNIVRRHNFGGKSFLIGGHFEVAYVATSGAKLLCW